MLKEEKLLFALNDVSDRQLEETRKRLGYGEREKRRVRPRRIGRDDGLCGRLVRSRRSEGRDLARL